MNATEFLGCILFLQPLRSAETFLCFFMYLPAWGLWTSEFNQSGRMFFTAGCQNSSGEVRLKEMRGYPMRMQTQPRLIKHYLKET